MRNKIILIKGFADIARHITLAEFERINADHVVVITALRRKQFLPPDFTLDLSVIEAKIPILLEHWRFIDQDHFVIAEYASVALDHGGDDVKVVEGECLRMPWLYDAIKTMHRHYNQIVIEAQVILPHPNEVWLKIEHEELPLHEAIERLKPHPSLG